MCTLLSCLSISLCFNFYFYVFRDSKELQKPTTTNAPVIRFYRYVQAARDGQEKHDCLKTYAACSFATEK